MTIDWEAIDSRAINEAECTVCRSDTALLCSPCGDPVCHNCACPNGCEELIHATVPLAA
jgi:hypothetical protein